MSQSSEGHAGTVCPQCKQHGWHTKECPTVQPTSVVNEVIDGRRGVYGEPVDTFSRMAQMISGLLDVHVHPWQVPLILIITKMVRTNQCPDYSDNSDDIEGYLAIFRELIGEDMVHARSVTEYLEIHKQRVADGY